MGADDTTRRVRDSVAALGRSPRVLAVSGGADSMVLLDAATSVLRRSDLVVATFDHGTGPAATHAVAMVAERAARSRVTCVIGHAGSSGRTEADWRRARWDFLHEAAAAHSASVVTAHTLDDQVETVFMRALRDAGPRGLAGLYATSPIVRPLLGITRQDVLRYAAEHGITFVTDPSNVDRRHLRNRVRLDLLPAIRAYSPRFTDDILDIARRAAEWRERMEAIALTFPMMTHAPGSYSFARTPLRGFPAPSLQVLWPALAARAGVVMDWRGTERLAAFTIEGETGQKIQLAGGVTVRMARETIGFQTEAYRDQR